MLTQNSIRILAPLTVLMKLFKHCLNGILTFFSWMHVVGTAKGFAVESVRLDIKLLITMGSQILYIPVNWTVE